MTLDEALASPWQKTGKTVEELLRNGTLSFRLLRELAKKADNERDQEIAKAIWLDYEQANSRVNPTRINQTILMNLPNVSMSVEDAMATPWKGRYHSGMPMGHLVENGQLSMQELGWAVENNWNERVREAARILLFQGLQARVQEPQKSGMAKVIQAAASYSKERIEDIGTDSAVAWGFGVGGVAMLLLQKSSLGGFHWFLWLLCFCAFAWSILSLVLRRKEKRAHSQGADEEDRVAARLATALDPSWTILRNVRKKGIPGDLDIVLVGPGGVYALEVKKWKAELRIEGEKTYFACDGKRRGGYGNPVGQVQLGAKALYQFLASKGVKVPVVPILVVSVDNLTLETPAVTVWRAEDAGQEAVWLPTSARSEFDAAKVVALLDDSGGK